MLQIPLAIFVLLLTRPGNMKRSGCCGSANITDYANTAKDLSDQDDRKRKHPGGLIARVLAFFRWIIPVSILALMPKCPVCLAAYIAVSTGIGISVSTAAYLRFALIIICASALVYLAAKLSRRSNPLLRHKQPLSPAPTSSKL